MDHMTSLWYRALLEEERAAAGDDLYVCGFAKTRHGVETLLRYAYRQGVVPRQCQAEEMFWPSMLQT